MRLHHSLYLLSASGALLFFCIGFSQASAQTITYKADTAVRSDTLPPAEEDEEPEMFDEPESEMPVRYYQTIPTDDEPEIRYYVKKRSRRSDIKTLSGSVSHSGGFGAFSFRATEFRGETMVLGGVRGGWIVNRTLGIGVEAHGIVPTAKYNDIDSTNRVVALGGYGGFFLEPIFFSNQVVHITFPVSAGAGWLGYAKDWEDYNPNSPNGDVSGDSDIFWYVEPGVDLEINVALNFRLALGISKRFVQDLNLEKTAPTDFNGLNYFLTLKIGGF